MPPLDLTPEVRDRLLAALQPQAYDGDAARPESGITVEMIADEALRAHWDMARCYCPMCVLARAVQEMT